MPSEQVILENIKEKTIDFEPLKEFLHRNHSFFGLHFVNGSPTAVFPWEYVLIITNTLGLVGTACQSIIIFKDNIGSIGTLLGS